MPLMPGCVLCLDNLVRFYRDSRRLPLAVTAAVEAESGGVLNFRVSGVGFTARHRRSSAVNLLPIRPHRYEPQAG